MTKVPNKRRLDGRLLRNPRPAAQSVATMTILNPKKPKKLNLTTCVHCGKAMRSEYATCSQCDDMMYTLCERFSDVLWCMEIMLRTYA